MDTGKYGIALVLLAAGDSRRFCGNKLLAKIGGMPMYRHLVDEIGRLPGQAFCRKVVVSQYREILEDLSAHGYEAVENYRSDLGISYSIRLGIQALRRGYEKGQAAHTAICFAVCDQPWLRGDTVLRLLGEWSASKKGMGCLSCKGRDGNPAVFSCCYEEELLSLAGDVGGRAVICRHQEDLYRCETTDPHELDDIDLPWRHNGF